MQELVDASSLETPAPRLSPALLLALTQQPVLAELEAAAAFGRWWFEPASSQLALSSAAARHLNVAARHHLHLNDCFIHVVADDMLALMARLSGLGQHAINQDFRVVNAEDGLRWLRMSALPPDAAQPHIVSGNLTDITPLKHAAMRERLGFELTEFLVGAHSLDAAVSNVIQLICKNLGWKWGAYWALEPSAQGEPQLACKNFWHHPDHDLASFSAESAIAHAVGDRRRAHRADRATAGTAGHHPVPGAGRRTDRPGQP